MVVHKKEVVAMVLAHKVPVRKILAHKVLAHKVLAHKVLVRRIPFETFVVAFAAAIVVE